MAYGASQMPIWWKGHSGNAVSSNCLFNVGCEEKFLEGDRKNYLSWLGCVQCEGSLNTAVVGGC